jgi:hypothetical protein
MQGALNDKGSRAVTCLLEQTFERTLDQIVREYSADRFSGGCLEAWVFADRRCREAAERLLKKAGVQARIRSAYKPLVHFFLEEMELNGVTAVCVRCPALPENPKRFRLEAYPLAALLGHIPLEFEDAGALEQMNYEVIVTREGSKEERIKVFAPNRRHVDAVGYQLVSPTGWVRWTGADQQSEESELVTDYQRLFDIAIDTVNRRVQGAEPYFEELAIEVTLPWRDQALQVGHESISLSEALHEDIYFTLLEVFQKRAGLALGDRSLRPGQIVPSIGFAEGALRLRIETRGFEKREAPPDDCELETADRPISQKQAYELLTSLPGEVIEGRSRAGREIKALYRPGRDVAVLISGAQHANETTGTVGALRAVRRLLKNPDAHFVVSPIENPDGYALHARLCVENPTHMHHAARYTGFGNDLANYAQPVYERAVREEALKKSGARLHLNLHGYPAHEWTRPLTGYLPRGFEAWSLPKGFFLIMRHHPEWIDVSEALLERITAHLGSFKFIRELNQRQLSLYKAHYGAPEFRMINGFPCQVTASKAHEIPLTLITEYPDETIGGEAFVEGHTAQMEAVLSGYDAFQSVMRARRPID